MSEYAVTLAFFLPAEIVEKLKKVNLSSKDGFDYRKTTASHCTIKLIYFGQTMPENKQFQEWIFETQKMVDGESAFDVKIGKISSFPATVYAEVHSSKLKQLHQKLFNSLPSSHPQFEGENYIPHISILTFLQSLPIIPKGSIDFGGFKVKEIQLVCWDLGNLSNPKIIHKFNLKK